METGEEIRRGEQAQRILDDPLYKESVSLIRENLLNELTQTQVRDNEGREFLYLLIRSLDTIQIHLQSVLETGQMATMKEGE